jgi:hypothetical protein
MDSFSSSASKFDDHHQELTKSTDALINTGTHLVESNDNTMQLLKSQRTYSFRQINLQLGQPGMSSNSGLRCLAPGFNTHTNALAKHDEGTCQIIIQPAPDFPETHNLCSLYQSLNFS